MNTYSINHNYVTGIFILIGITLPYLSIGQPSFESSNLPIVIIDTEGLDIPDEPKIPAQMGIIDNGDDQRNNITDPPNDYDGFIGIEIRGSSSQDLFPKKSYGIELWDEEGHDIDAPILGMPDEEDWVLYGPYSDKTLIRNFLTFKMGRDLGSYASRTRLCEVIINGNYMGVYVFMEKIKRDKNRVDINKLKSNEIEGDDLTGGYIIKIDKMTGSGGDGWESDYPPLNPSGGQFIFFQYEYPKSSKIVPEQKEYIQDYLSSFESILKSDTYNHPTLGYSSVIDPGSFIDFFLVNEVTRNVDGYRLSTFLYKDKNERLHMGPLWDFNIALGNVNTCNGWLTAGWAWKFNSICNHDFWLVPFWWDRLLQDDSFNEQMRTRWEELRESTWQTPKLLNYIDSVAAVLDESQIRNFEKWPVLGQYIWPNPFVGNTYADEIGYLKFWLSARLDWLDRNIGLVTGSETVAIEEQVNIYPNPFNNRLFVELGNIKKKVIFELYDNMGRLLDQKQIKNQLFFEYSLSELDNKTAIPSKGIYLIVLKARNQIIFTGTLIRQ